jgi:hypothetical protein
MSKKKYKIIKPIGFSGRREIGEIVEMTDEQARAIGNEYIAVEPEPATAGEASETPVEEAKVEGEPAVKPKRTRKAK